MRILLGSISVLPTHVGVILYFNTEQEAIDGTTHTRGGDPRLLQYNGDVRVYYPHTWG